MFAWFLLEFIVSTPLVLQVLILFYSRIHNNISVHLQIPPTLFPKKPCMSCVRGNCWPETQTSQEWMNGDRARSKNSESEISFSVSFFKVVLQGCCVAWKPHVCWLETNLLHSFPVEQRKAARNGDKTFPWREHNYASLHTEPIKIPLFFSPRCFIVFPSGFRTVPFMNYFPERFS